MGVLARLFAGSVGGFAVYALWATALAGPLANQAHVEIARPPSAVFPYLVEERHLTRWLEGLIESRPQGDATMGVGLRSVEVVEVDGRPLELAREVLAFEPDRRMRVRLASEQMVVENEYVLERSGSGTRIEYTSDTSMLGPAALLAPFMRAPIRRRIEADFSRLRALVEAEVPVGS